MIALVALWLLTAQTPAAPGAGAAGAAGASTSAPGAAPSGPTPSAPGAAPSGAPTSAASAAPSGAASAAASAAPSGAASAAPGAGPAPGALSATPAPAAPAAAGLPEAAPLGLDVQVAPEELSLGEHVVVRIAVDHDLRDVYALPAFDPAPLAVPQGAPPPRVQREEVAGHARTVFEFALADYGSLTPRLPDLTLHVTGPGGERALTIRGRPLKFRSLLKEEGAAANDEAHHGPKPPLPVLVRSLLWLWILLGAAFLAGSALFLRYMLKKKQLPKEKLPALVEADDRALQQLAALRLDAPWKRGEGRAAIFRLSEIVRGYLGARLQFNALDLTSEEFIAGLQRRRLMGLDLAELAEEVRWEDLVKFARLEPTPEECLRGLSRAESLVRHTRPLRALPQAPGAAA